MYNVQFTIKIVLLLLSFYILHCTFYIPAFAAEATPSVQINDIGYSRIDPTSPFYFLKTIRENLEMKLAQTTRVRNLRQLEFATRRLREAKTLVGKNEDLIPPTLERYMAHLNSLTENHLKSEQQFADDLKNNLSIHLALLRQIYDQGVSIRTKMFIRSVMNRVIKRADVPNYVKLPVCNFFLREASSSSLNQTEQLVLRDRGQNCLESIKVLH